MAYTPEEIPDIDTRGLFLSMNIRGEVCSFYFILLNTYFYTVNAFVDFFYFS